MTNIRSPRLNKSIAFIQLAQQGLFVSLFDLLGELRMEHSACVEEGDVDGIRDVVVVISFLQLILDNTPIDSPVLSPNDYLKLDK